MFSIRRSGLNFRVLDVGNMGRCWVYEITMIPYPTDRRIVGEFRVGAMTSSKTADWQNSQADKRNAPSRVP